MKKYINLLLTLFCCLSVFLFVSPTFAKFHSITTGTLYGTFFSDFAIIATEFVVGGENYDSETGTQVSDNLWGLSQDNSDDLDSLPSNNNFILKNLSSVQFSAYNDTNDDLLITFVLCLYMQNNKSGTLTLGAKNIEATSDESKLSGSVTKPRVVFGSAPDLTSNEFETRKGTDTVTESYILEYQQYYITIDPQLYYSKVNTLEESKEKQYIEQYFVIKPKERKSFNISSVYSENLNISNSYSTIKMVSKKYVA